MKYSIVVPIYNIEKYLPKCVESILGQQYPDFEVILVDDGSTDSSPSICDKYKAKDSRIQVIHKPNGGLVSARQAGCKIATGDYVICVDGDDWIDSKHLLTINQIAEQQKTDIICFNYYNVIDGVNYPANVSMPNGLIDSERLEKEIYPELIYSQKTGCSQRTAFPKAIWSKAFKRELYVNEQLKLDPRIKIGEDILCVVPCIYHANNIYCTDECLYYYRYNDESMTKNRKPFSWDGTQLAQRHLLRNLELEKFDFEQQIYRGNVHSLFNIVKSQFYGDKGYCQTATEIRRKLQIPEYQRAMQNAKFKKSYIMRFIQLALKRRWLFLIYIISKVK